eukprot:396789-Amphidinium_carterae.1
MFWAEVLWRIFKGLAHVRDMKKDVEQPDVVPMPSGLFCQETVKVCACPDEQLGIPTSVVGIAQHTLDVNKPWLVTHGTKDCLVVLCMCRMPHCVVRSGALMHTTNSMQHPAVCLAFLLPLAPCRPINIWLQLGLLTGTSVLRHTGAIAPMPSMTEEN